MAILLLVLGRWRRHLLHVLLRDGLLLVVVLNTGWWGLGCGGWLVHVVVNSGVVLLLLLAAKKEEDSEDCSD